MKKLFISLCLFSLFAFAQNEQLAGYYYDRGDFEKAKMGYEELLVNISKHVFLKLIDCYQQLQQFNSAEKAIQADLKTTRKPC
jgi:tetratricopeptide (TPR) repeat protein